MYKQTLKNIVLSSSILLVGLTAMTTIDTPINPNQAHAYHIPSTETDTAKLKAYYTQTPQVQYDKYFSYLPAYQTFRIQLHPHKWAATIQPSGEQSSKNLKALHEKHVDLFGLTDKDQTQHWWTYHDYYTGGITPAHKASDPERTLKFNIKKFYKNRNFTYTGSFEFFQTKKPVLTMKELDFRIREEAIKTNFLYENGVKETGSITITMQDGNEKTFDINKRIEDHFSNEYIKTADIKTISVNIEA